jgi:CII-binding regulator of phage lambda lysogenization HflD
MDAKKLAAWGVASTLVTSHIPSNITYTMAETTKEMNRQSVRKENTSLEIPTNIDSYPFVLQTETRLARVETKIDSVERRLEGLSENFTYLSNDVKNLASEFRVYLDSKFTYLEGKFDRLEGKIDRLGDKISTVENTVNRAKWFIAGAITVIGALGSILISIASYMGSDKVAKAIISAIAKLVADH